MGIISFFKDLHYSNKLENAEKLLNEGKSSEAERILISILDKHPLAARKLAVYYRKLASKADVDKTIMLFNKTLAIQGKGGEVYDVASYEEILNNFAEYIENEASTYFNSESYSDCYALLSALNATKCKSTNSVNLCNEAQIRLTLTEIASTKATDSRFNTLINKFKSDWSNVKDISRANKYCVDFCDKLEFRKRYYASNALLSIILDGIKNFKFLDNVVKIVSGYDVEASSSLLKETVSQYGKDIVFRDGILLDTAVDIFDKCWIVSKDSDFVIDVLKSVKDNVMRDAIIATIISNHSSYLSISVLHRNLCNWISNYLEGQQALQLFEKLHSLGYEMEMYYVAKVHSFIASMPCDDKVKHLDHALSLFPNSHTIIEDKFECAKWYLNNNENDKAISIADSIMSKKEKARLIKSNAIFNIAKAETDIGKKEELLNKAKEIIENKTDVDYQSLYDCILSNLLEIAEQYYSSNNYGKSFEILHNLAKEGYINAIGSIAKHRLNEIRACISIEQKEKVSNDAIDEISEFKKSLISGIIEYQTIWDEYIVSYIDSRKMLDNESAVRDLEVILDKIETAGFVTQITKDKQMLVINEIIKRKYLIARKLELDGKINDAIELYKNINSLESTSIPTLSALRFIICKLKTGNNTDIIQHNERIYSLLRAAPDSFKAEKEDAAYRFALILLKCGEDKKALEVISEFIPNEEYLKKACLQNSMIKAQAKLEDFNNKLEAVNNRTLSSEDAISFLNHLLEYSEIINPILNISRQTLGRYRTKLKNYAIFKLFDEEKYDIAFEKMLKEHTDYLNDLTALRNIALICLNMAETKQVTYNNYEDVIAIWLTAIYQEKVFIKSLDYTSWDDPYTFSLDGAYGHFDEYTVGELPENVNFDNIDDNIISIKEVQRTLLDRFESAISDNQQYHEFYTVQKDAMDALIALNLDQKCRLVAPHLINKNKEVYKEITDALEQDRKQNYENWEDVLSVGILYHVKDTIYSEYGNAKKYNNNCIDALNSGSKAKVQQVFNTSTISCIRQFNKMYSALVSNINSKVSSLSSKDKADFDNNYNFYLPICEAIKDNTLSYVFSNFVMHFIEHNFESQNISLANVGDYFLSIYLLDCNNTNVKENLTALFHMLIRTPTSENNNAVTNILAKVRTKDRDLYNKLKADENNIRINVKIEEIANKLHSNSMSKVEALEEVYALYDRTPNNSMVCENLAQLCVVCIMDYIVADDIRKNRVESILNRLLGNISDEFRRNNSCLRITFEALWVQIDKQTQQLMTAAVSVQWGPQLNNKGKALEEGLRYMALLGKRTIRDNTVFDY